MLNNFDFKFFMSPKISNTKKFIFDLPDIIYENNFIIFVS